MITVRHSVYLDSSELAQLQALVDEFLEKIKKLKANTLLSLLLRHYRGSLAGCLWEMEGVSEHMGALYMAPEHALRVSGAILSASSVMSGDLRFVERIQDNAYKAMSKVVSESDSGTRMKKLPVYSVKTF